MKSTVICLLFLAFESMAQAASFDCAKATTIVEKLICADGQLSELDAQLSLSYKKTMSDSSNIDNLKTDQRKWITTVRNSCQDSACLKLAYVQRISQLDGKATLPKQAEPQIRPSVNAANHQDQNDAKPNAPVSQLNDRPAREGTPVELSGIVRKSKGAKVIVMIPPPVDGLPDVKSLAIQPDWAHKVKNGETAITAYNRAMIELKRNRDAKEAAKWLTYSTYFGSIDAAEVLGELYLTGMGDEYKKKELSIEAKKLFIYADTHGNAKATIRLGMLYWYGEAGEKIDINGAILAFERAVKNGEKLGITKLAIIAATVDSRNPKTPQSRARELKLEGHSAADEKAAYAALSRLGISAAEARKMAKEADDWAIDQRAQSCSEAKKLHAMNLSANHVDDGFRDNGHQGCQ